MCTSEGLWTPFDLLLLQCHDVSSETVSFLTEKGYTSLQQLKSQPIGSLNTLFTNIPLPGLQIYHIFKLLTEFKSPCVSTETAYDIAMTKPHMDSIVNNTEMLIKIIDVDPLIKRLKAYQTLSKEDVAKIFAHTNDPDKVMKLFEVIQKKPDICFLYFMQSLRETKQGHVANMIERSLCDEPVPGIYSD